MTGAVRVNQQWPKIKSRHTSTLSPWVDIIAREVEFAPDEPTQTYHAVGQLDYLAIVALTPDGRFPLVRQYRPALEAFTLELPAGLAEPAVSANCSRRPDIPRAPSTRWERRRPAPDASATGSIPISCKPKTASITSRLNPVLALNWRPHLNSSR